MLLLQTNIVEQPRLGPSANTFNLSSPRGAFGNIDSGRSEADFKFSGSYR